MLKEDRLLLNLLIVCLLCGFIQAGLIFSYWKLLPPLVPIFYSEPWGERLLGARWVLLVLPSICIANGLLNFAIAKYLARKSAFLSSTLIYVSLLIAFVTFYDVVKIIFLLV